MGPGGNARAVSQHALSRALGGSRDQGHVCRAKKSRVEDAAFQELPQYDGKRDWCAP